jgi:S1-C subfamily serine protease
MSKQNIRLCYIRKWPHFTTGFGFNFKSSDIKNGLFIGRVDKSSPAEAAGLKADDQIIEVNYKSIDNESYENIIQRIKEGIRINGRLYKNDVALLVISRKKTFSNSKF